MNFKKSQNQWKSFVARLTSVPNLWLNAGFTRFLRQSLQFMDFLRSLSMAFRDTWINQEREASNFAINLWSMSAVHEKSLTIIMRLSNVPNTMACLKSSGSIPARSMLLDSVKNAIESALSTNWQYKWRWRQTQIHWHEDQPRVHVRRQYRIKPRS